MNHELLYLIIGAIAFITLIFIFWAIKTQREQREKFERIGNSLGARYTKGTFLKHPKLEGEFSERLYELTFHTESQGRTSKTVLDLITPVALFAGKMHIKKSGGFDKFLKKLNLSKPISSGDPFFDEKVEIRGEPEDKVLGAMNAAYFRESVKKILARGYTIKAEKARLIASKDFAPAKDLDEIVLREDLNSLLELAKAIEKGR